MKRHNRPRGHFVTNKASIRRFQKAALQSGLTTAEICELTGLSLSSVNRLRSWRPGDSRFLSGTMELADEFSNAYLTENRRSKTEVESDSTQLELPLKVRQDPKREDRQIDELQRRVAALESSVSTLHAVVVRLLAQGGLMV